MNYRHGLVIGKFYPPHLGHAYLIEQAQAKCHELTIVVCDHHTQKISGQTRAKWLQQSFPHATIKVVEDAIDEHDSQLWAKLVQDTLGLKPDVVFTSENYGQNFAKQLGAKHILVDINRETVPISGTKIRDNINQHWDYLLPSARYDLAIKVCVVGAESTGTTTLAQNLATHYDTVWVPEFGRYYWEGRRHLPESIQWKTEDFITIARNQNTWEKSLAPHSRNQLLICDTDSFATTLWHEHYRGDMSPTLSTIRNNEYADLYILTAPDFELVQDGTREGIDERRLQMHERFLSELKRMKLNFTTVHGSKSNRLQMAVKCIDDLRLSRELF